MVTVILLLLNILSICTHPGSQPETALTYLLVLKDFSLTNFFILETYTFCGKEIQF